MNVDEIQKEVFLNYGLYIMSLATSKSGNTVKLDKAQELAFKIGQVADIADRNPFAMVTELDEFYRFGLRNKPENKDMKIKDRASASNE